jgi:hypothetical protein
VDEVGSPGGRITGASDCETTRAFRDYTCCMRRAVDGEARAEGEPAGEARADGRCRVTVGMLVWGPKVFQGRRQGHRTVA